MADEKDIFGLVWAATHNDRPYPSAAETRPKQKLRFPTLLPEEIADFTRYYASGAR